MLLNLPTHFSISNDLTSERPKVMVPYHGTMGPAYCISLLHVLRDIVEET